MSGDHGVRRDLLAVEISTLLHAKALCLGGWNDVISATECRAVETVHRFEVLCPIAENKT
jgi:hypothetical protein